MDPGQQFCLRWNNYQSTLQYVFYKLWTSGTFVDASLVVEGRRIDCHKVVLSACSSYFEEILQEHNSQHHPLILLHDMPFAAVEALVAFMYRGEVNVSHSILGSLLQVAETLKVKGLGDSSALSNFTKRKLVERCVPQLDQAPTPTYAATALAPVLAPQNRFGSIPGANTIPTPAIVQPRMVSNTLPNIQPSVQDRTNLPTLLKQANKAVKRQTKSRSPGPKKRQRQEINSGSMPASPVSAVESSSCELPVVDAVASNENVLPSSPPQLTNYELLRQDTSDETDGELQIDESAGHSPAVAADANLTESESEKELGIEESKVPILPEKENTSAIDTESVNVEPPLQPQQTQTTPIDPLIATKLERKALERAYTQFDLEQGIEAVLLGHLTPAKAIAQYRIPRRTFFRRLSAVRKSRGIPSAKENAADQFLNSTNAVKKESRLPPLLQTESNSDSYSAAPFKVKSEKQLVMDPKETKAKATKKTSPVMTPTNSYFTLLKLAASNNYDTYIKYLRMVAQQNGHSKPEEVLEALKKGQLKDIKQTVDDNRNVATEVSEAAFCLVNKNLTSEAPESPLSLVNGNKPVNTVAEVAEALCTMDNESKASETDNDQDAPMNLCNTPQWDIKSEDTSDEELCKEDTSPAQELLKRDMIPVDVNEIPHELLLSRRVTSNSTTEVPQNLVSRNNNNKMTAEVS